METAADPNPNKRRHSQPERRKTRALTVSPWVKGILIAGATSAFLSLPAVFLHAYKTMRSIDNGMQAVERMADEYKVVVKQNVTLQVQVHRLTDAVNDLRHEKGLAPIEQQAIIGATPAEVDGIVQRVPEIRASLKIQE